MNDRWLTLYHRLPGPMQSIAAGARGLYLHSWRYSTDTERLIDEARERERWTAEQWDVWRHTSLPDVLEHAARAVPYYREYWRQQRAAGNTRPITDLHNWPILEKETVRANPEAFVADEGRERVYREHTSGTTGTPIELVRSARAVQQLYALSELRERRWSGVSIRQRWAIFGGQLVAPIERRSPPFWVWNRPLNQLYMSSYHLAPDLVPHYLDAMKQHRISYVWGYTSSLYALAHEALRLGRRDLVMKVAITNAEPLSVQHRQVIQDAFQCPVRETYGLAEMVVAASECEAGRLHLWPEMGVVELHSVGTDGTGELVCTGLVNRAMPLIRYRVGDRAGLDTRSGTCKCGRTLPLLSHIEGRLDDAVYTRDGRRIGRLDPVFKTRLPLHEAQIVQESLDRVRVVAGAEIDDAALQPICDRLRDRLGEMEVVLERVDQIPRTGRGKFRAVVCALSEHERQAVGA
jgi:phenylacetate-coenzyme A ligase PaaK-like adenylate-forming protein